MPQGTYELNTLTTGSSTNAITRTGALQFVAGKVYTVARAAT
jgi:hypothetical protein